MLGSAPIRFGEGNGVRIRMTQTAIGCDDGIRAAEYAAGSEHDVSEALARAFMGSGVAVAADAPPAAPVAAPAEPAACAPPVVAPKKNTAQKAPQRRKTPAKGKGGKKS